jgi:hypothetical protein
MNRWDIVLAYWVDSAGTARWTDTEVALGGVKVSPCWTAGFYFAETDDCIAIASSASDNDQVDHIMYIPKVALIKLQLIKKGIIK